MLVFIAASYLAGLAWSFAVRFADILLLLALAWLLAFALEPVSALLEARVRMGRMAAVGTVYLGLLVVLSIAILLLVPVIALQATQIGINLPDYIEGVGAWMSDYRDWLSQRGAVGHAIASLDYREVTRNLESLGPGLVNNAVALATGVASVLFSLILVLMFSFYIMLDGSRMTAALLRFLPSDYLDDFTYFLYSTHRAFGGFIRGQLIQAAILGAGTAVTMLAASLPYNAVTSLFVVVIMMVPFIGPILAIVPPVAISLFVAPDRTWWVFLVLLALQQVVLNVLAPRVMSQTVGMHPLLVLLSLLVGAKLAGVWGAVFAIPVAGVAVAMITFYRMSSDERTAQSNRLAGEGSNGFPQDTSSGH